MKEQDNPLKAARTAILTTFFVSGLLVASWFPHIPGVQERLGISEGVLGFALLGLAGGAVIAMPLSGAWISRFGSRWVTTVASFALCLVLPLPVLASTVPMLVLALLILGASMGAMDVAMNAQAVAIEEQYDRPIMSAFHGFFSLGGLLGAAIGSITLTWQIAPHWHMLTMGVLMVIVVAAVMRNFLDDAADASEQASHFALPSRPVLGLGILAFMVLIVEGAVADWSAVYLRNALATTQGVAALGYAAFSLTMAIGRLTGDRFVANIGTVTLVRGSALLAAIGLGAALLIGHPVAAIIGFGCVGLGLSNLIPVLFSAAGHVDGVPAGTGIASVATMGYLGFMVGPPLIGLVAEATSLPVALGLVVGAILTVAVFANSAE